jgi:hypothetical protein
MRQGICERFISTPSRWSDTPNEPIIRDSEGGTMGAGKPHLLDARWGLLQKGAYWLRASTKYFATV